MNKNRKFLMVTLGTAGDIYPFMGISLGLKEQGHVVTLLTNEHYRSLAMSAAIDFHPIGPNSEYQSLLAAHETWDMRRGFRPLWQHVEPTINRVYKYIEREASTSECIIVTHPATVPASRMAKERFNNIKIVTVYLAPQNIRTYCDPQLIGSKFIPENTPKQIIKNIYRQMDSNLIDPVSVPGLNALRNNLGLPPIQHLRDHMQGGADFSVALFPEWYSSYQQDWPDNLAAGEFLLYDAHTGEGIPDIVEQFLNKGEPPIVFTYGTGMRFAGNFFQISLDICLRMGKRAIFLSKYRKEIPNVLPDTIIHCDYVPFGSLLKRVAGIVHHGGIGSCAEVMKAGIPQIIVPMVHDQFHNGFRIEKLGIGFSIMPKRYNVTVVTRVLEGLLNSKSVQTNCIKISEKFHPHPIKRVCQLIEAGISGSIT